MWTELLLNAEEENMCVQYKAWYVCVIYPSYFVCVMFSTVVVQ